MPKSQIKTGLQKHSHKSEINYINTVSGQIPNYQNFSNNFILKWDDSSGKLINSTIQDDGSDVTISANLILSTGHNLKLVDGTISLDNDTTIISATELNVLNGVGALTDDYLSKYDSGNNEFVDSVISDDGSTATVAGDLEMAGGAIDFNQSSMLSYAGSDIFKFWTGSYSFAIGVGAGVAKTYSYYLGNYCGYNNTGIYFTGVGGFCGSYQSGDYFSGLGPYCGGYNLGDYFTGIGLYVGYGNIGSNFIGIGYKCGMENVGTYFSGIGTYCGRYNVGGYFSGYGAQTGYNNTGNYFTGLAYYVGYRNTGNYFVGVGYYVGYKNDSDYITALGANSFTNFDQDNANEEIFDHTDIDVANDRVTVTGHGFGGVGTYLNLEYEEGTAPITGFVDGEIHQWKVIDANTMECITDTITGAGAGTGHKIIPRFQYNYSVAIGYDSEPDAANQVMLGNSSTLEVKTFGGLTVGDDSTIDGSLKVGDGGTTDYLEIDNNGIVTMEGNSKFSGTVGIGTVAESNEHLIIEDLTVDTTTHYYGISSRHVKTGGATDSADDFYGLHNETELNHNGSTIGYLTGFYNETKINDGTTDNNTEGIYNKIIGSGGTVDSMIGTTDFLDVNTGTITNDVIGNKIDIDIEDTITSIGGDIFGQYIKIDADKDPVGNAYMLYLKELTNIDYGIYQDGTADNIFQGQTRFGEIANYFQISATGVVTLEADARVKKDLWVNVTGLKAPGTKPATQVDYGIGDAWEFTDGTDDTVVSRIKLPEDMDKSAGIEISIGWNTPTGSAGNCKWDIEYLFRQANEAMDAVADATLTATVAASATAKGLVVSSIGTTAVPHANDVCITIRVKRRADEAADTLGEDNYLFGVCFKYLSNKLGLAM